MKGQVIRRVGNKDEKAVVYLIRHAEIINEKRTTVVEI